MRSGAKSATLPFKSVVSLLIIICPPCFLATATVSLQAIDSSSLICTRAKTSEDLLPLLLLLQQEWTRCQCSTLLHRSQPIFLPHSSVLGSEWMCPSLFARACCTHLNANLSGQLIASPLIRFATTSTLDACWPLTSWLDHVVRSLPSPEPVQYFLTPGGHWIQTLQESPFSFFLFSVPACLPHSRYAFYRQLA